MKSNIIVMCVGVIVIVVALLSSKIARAVFREAVFHPRRHCKIQVRGKGISIKRAATKEELEG